VEALDALLQDLQRAGCHLVVAVVDSKVEDLRVWRTTNHLVTRMLAELLVEASCEDLNRIMGDEDE
jgi:hypothetical protein